MKKEKFEELVRETKIAVKKDNPSDYIFGILPKILFPKERIDEILRRHDKKIKFQGEEIKELQLKTVRKEGLKPDCIIFDDLLTADLKKEVEKLKFIIKEGLKMDPDEYVLITENKTEIKLVKKEKIARGKHTTSNRMVSFREKVLFLS